MQTIRIAYKNVMRNFRRSALLGSAIAFGFFILTLINGFTGGLNTTIRDNFSGILGGHIYITGEEVSDRSTRLDVIRNTDTILEAIKPIEGEIDSANFRTFAGAVLIWGGSEEDAFLTGVDIDVETEFLKSLQFAEGGPEAFLNNPNAVILPENIVEDLGVQVGETIIVRAETVNGQQNVDDLVIAASIATNAGFAVSSYTHIDKLNTLLNMNEGEFQSYNIYLKNVKDVDSITETLYAELDTLGEVAEEEESTNLFGPPPSNTVKEEDRWEGTMYDVENVNDNLSFLTNVIRSMDQVALGIFFIILLIIMVGLMNSYRMVMIERTAEIGTMRAMGVQKAAIRNIFVWEALFVAVTGALVGLILALLTMFGLSFIDLNRFEDFTFFFDKGKIFFENSVPRISLNLLLLSIMSMLAVLVPARAAANLEPAEALRS